jgi:dTDP-4-dehydrorhamnose reductase
LIHISTDYVFDGTATQPYKETDKVNPVNTYGASKLKGEELALQNNPQTIILRASWLYAEHGHNFLRTMLKLMSGRESINVVNDQSGCPTYTADLAEAIMQVIVQLPTANCKLPAIFNYSNAGITTWFGFASAIKEFTGSACIVQPIPTSQYPTPAKRPQYSVLDTTKIHETFHLHIPEWKDSLQNCLKALG